MLTDKAPQLKAENHHPATRKQCRIACTNCKKSSKKCADERPCPRCMKLNVECIEGLPRRRRAKGLVRGPYKITNSSRKSSVESSCLGADSSQSSQCSYVNCSPSAANISEIVDSKTSLSSQISNQDELTEDHIPAYQEEESNSQPSPKFEPNKRVTRSANIRNRKTYESLSLISDIFSSEESEKEVMAFTGKVRKSAGGGRRKGG